MSMTDFVRMVIELRRLQKEYFRTRDRLVLIEAKKLERTIDDLAPAILRELEAEPSFHQ